MQKSRSPFRTHRTTSYGLMMSKQTYLPITHKHLSSPSEISDDGKQLFKQRVAECITYADVLREFVSARPPIEELIGTLVPAIKPRHYSIASSMNMHPNSVHLLVVLHDWNTPAGAYKVCEWLRCCICTATAKLMHYQLFHHIPETAKAR